MKEEKILFEEAERFFNEASTMIQRRETSIEDYEVFFKEVEPPNRH